MAQQTINIGAAPDDGTGDTLRVGGDKINDNFDELYAADAALGTAAALNIDTDDTLAADSDALIPTQQAVKAYVDASGGGGGVNVEDEGVAEATGATVLNFTGAGVTATDAGGGQVDIAIPGGGSVTFASTADVHAGTEAAEALSPDNVFDAAAFVALTDGATVTPDFATGFNFTWTIAGNRTLANPSNTKEGQTGVIQVTQDGTGSRTISAYGANYCFAGGTDIVLSTAASSVDLLFYQVLPGGLIFLTAQKAIAA